MNDEVLQALLESKHTAAAVARECVDAAAAGALGRDRLAESLRSYILAKYRITEEDCASDSMDELSRASMDKLAVLGADACEGDTASNCDGANCSRSGAEDSPRLRSALPISLRACHRKRLDLVIQETHTNRLRGVFSHMSLRRLLLFP